METKKWLACDAASVEEVLVGKMLERESKANGRENNGDGLGREWDGRQWRGGGSRKPLLAHDVSLFRFSQAYLGLHRKPILAYGVSLFGLT